MLKTKIGIIILNYNKWEETIKCIDSIRKTCGKPIMIYIVDNGSTNDSYFKLTSQYKNIIDIKIIKNKENVGYAAGNNIGIIEAIKDNIDYFIISNSDIIFESETIDKMVDFIIENNKCGIVGPNIKELNGKYSVASRINTRKMKEIFFSNFKINLFNMRTKVLNNYHYMNIPFEDTHEVEMVSGACFCVRKSFLVKTGLLDENTFLYFEEPIISYKLKESNYVAFHLGDVSVIHAHGASTSTIPAFSYIQFCCSYIYYGKSYLRKTNLELIFMYLLFTLKYFYKSLFSKNFRENINLYFYETILRLTDPYGKKCSK